MEAFGSLNPLNAELNPICHLLALLGGATIVVVSRLRVKLLMTTSMFVAPRNVCDATQYLENHAIIRESSGRSVRQYCVEDIMTCN